MLCGVVGIKKKGTEGLAGGGRVREQDQPIQPKRIFAFQHFVSTFSLQQSFNDNMTIVAGLFKSISMVYDEDVEEYILSGWGMAKEMDFNSFFPSRLCRYVLWF